MAKKLRKYAESYRLRLRRRYLRQRAIVKRRELTLIGASPPNSAPDDIFCFATLRNEIDRLPWFLQYYRQLGITHFFLIDNGSDDGGLDYLASQPDVSLWRTKHSYRRARYGMDWINGLLRRYGTGHWCLTVDIDELFIYPFHETRPLAALTDWLDGADIRSFGAMLLDLYPRGPLQSHRYTPGTDPLQTLRWFDAGNYIMKRDSRFGNLWIQGGPRARSFFASKPRLAPALNKIPLVKWKRHYAYRSSTHSLLPRGLNLVYDTQGLEKACGILLHTKFQNNFLKKASVEIKRGQHYANAGEYRHYSMTSEATLDLWCNWSERYLNWRQLEILGLMSRGSWA